MPLSAAELQAKLDKMSTNMDRLNAIVNGGDTSSTDVDSGVVPSIAKLVKDIDDDVRDILHLAQVPGGTVAKTWAELTSFTQTQNKVPGFVLGPDGGTHTDPVSGATVPNTGMFQWSSSPAGWTYIGFLSTASDPIASDAGFLWGLVDGEYHIAIGVKADGSVYLRLSADSVVPASALESAVLSRLLPSGTEAADLIADSGFLAAWVDSELHIGCGVKKDGSFYARLSDDSTIPGAILAAFYASQNLVPNKALAWWGDSLSAGAGGGGTTPLSACLALLADGRTGYNGGIGGQTSDQIAARQGGISITVSVSGAQIPASGGVSVTAKSVNPLYNSGSYTGTLAGTLAGIAGTMSTDSSGNWTFTRSTAGSVTACPDGSVFVPDLAAAHEKDTVVIWSGRNNLSALTTVRDNILAMVARLTPQFKRVLVLGVLNGTSETSGTSNYNSIVALNTELSRLLGDRYLDVRKWLVERGLSEAGLTATSQDTTDMAGDTPPTSLRSDGIHLNAAGYTAVGNMVARAIKARGW